MTNIFEETYITIQKAREAYENAATDKERDAARETAREAKRRIQNLGDIAWTVYRAYEKSKDNKNDILNFNDIIWDRDVEPLTACMKENGIIEFTYSCSATDAVETLWLFREAGCTIGEMVEVNLRPSIWGDGYDTAHAFKMTIN